MPSIKEIQKTSKFKKKAYRPWNMEGEEALQEVNLSDEKLNQKLTANGVYEIDPKEIENWGYHDRPESELGDVSGLAQEFHQIGQQQPCIVRIHPIKPERYELIIGERRWRAAIKAKLPLKVIITEYDDNTAALAQAAENDNRVNLSDYAKGMSFSKLIEQGIVKQKDLVEKLGKSKQYISALLSFNKIPPVIIDAIGDMSKVSARTAEKIKQLADKGEEHIQAIISLSHNISEGSIGHSKLEQAINRSFKDKEIPPANLSLEVKDKKVLSSDGRHIFTWRKDNNHLPSIHFPKSIVSLLNNNELNLEDLTEKFGQIMETELDKIKKSAWADKKVETKND